MRVYGSSFLTNGDMSGPLTSSNIQLQSSWGAGISCVVTSAAGLTGTLAILGSADGVHFTNLQTSGTNVTLSVTGNGTFIFDTLQTALQYLQITWTNSGGTGTLNIYAYVKGSQT